MANRVKEPLVYIHGSKLTNKIANVEVGKAELEQAYEFYDVWKRKSLAVKEREDDDIRQLVEYLNDYKNQVEPIFDARSNSAQEVLQPSILEEFFEYLFCNIEDVLGKELLRKPAKSFIDLVFNPSSVDTLTDVPEYTFRRKDHDFVLGATINLAIESTSTENRCVDELVIPAIAIECKRYLERNMLDECSGTADRVKRATPYCKYFVVAEYLKMDDASPEMSVIDEIYILRRQKNSERLADDFVPNPIYSDLVIHIYQKCITHLKRVWWDPESALTEGKVFNYD